MDHHSFANTIRGALVATPSEAPAVAFDEEFQRNAARCMQQLIVHRLSTNGDPPKRIKHTTYHWNGGLFALRNARITDHHWSTLQLAVADQLHQEANRVPVAYLLTYWAIDERELHAWVLPENVAYLAFSELPPGRDGNYKTIEVFPGTHSLKNAPNAQDLSPYYVRSDLLDAEVARLREAIKMDGAAKLTAQTEADSDEIDEAVEGAEVEEQPLFTAATVTFVAELPDHTEDAAWHTRNKTRYEKTLRDPTRRLADAVRDRYVGKLSAEVAGGKRLLSILKKNDYGRSGYHPHYWFAFYDPAAGSKTRSTQLFFHIEGSNRTWGYGFGAGSYGQSYFERLQTAIRENRTAVAAYLRGAPVDTKVHLQSGEQSQINSPAEFATQLESGWPGKSESFTSLSVRREYPLDSLPDHSETIVDDVGRFFVWSWPLFEASRTGAWPGSTPTVDRMPPAVAEIEDVDEEAAETLAELHELTALPIAFLEQLEYALAAKQQVVLVGPPGTSKTYIARQFARYFVRQRRGQPQGRHHVLYMHTNWTYEDFFEGIRPDTTKEGHLAFRAHKGFFLEWAESLQDFEPAARHVLVLDEINRCDTAAVLGELLQLLEYRGTTIRLLSGRPFVFPRNLFIIGTMNSADRSIGRMDLALRRRFLWLELYPQPEALQQWLNRTGNNPVRFRSTTLLACNELLAGLGIPPEQHIGHALFMVQGSDIDDESARPLDIPLTPKHLQRIVDFSVVPYVRELLMGRSGQVDTGVIQQIRCNLLSCLGETSESTQGTTHAAEA